LTPDEARKTLCLRWVANWVATSANFVFENEDNKNFDAGTSPWARVSVRHTVGGQETLGPAGSRIFERRGILLVQLFTPKDSGMQAGAVLANSARAIFEGVSFSGVDCYNGQVREVGPDGKWFQHVAEVDFRYYETK